MKLELTKEQGMLLYEELTCKVAECVWFDMCEEDKDRFMGLNRMVDMLESQLEESERDTSTCYLEGRRIYGEMCGM